MTEKQPQETLTRRERRLLEQGIDPATVPVAAATSQPRDDVEPRQAPVTVDADALQDGSGKRLSRRELRLQREKQNVKDKTGVSSSRADAEQVKTVQTDAAQADAAQAESPGTANKTDVQKQTQPGAQTVKPGVAAQQHATVKEANQTSKKTSPEQNKKASAAPENKKTPTQNADTGKEAKPGEQQRSATQPTQTVGDDTAPFTTEELKHAHISKIESPPKPVQKSAESEQAKQEKQAKQPAQTPAAPKQTQTPQQDPETQAATPPKPSTPPAQQPQGDNTPGKTSKRRMKREERARLKQARREAQQTAKNTAVKPPQTGQGNTQTVKTSPPATGHTQADTPTGKTKETTPAQPRTASSIPEKNATQTQTPANRAKTQETPPKKTEPKQEYSFPDIQPLEEHGSVFDDPSTRTIPVPGEDDEADFDQLINRAVAQESDMGSATGQALILPKAPRDSDGIKGALGQTGQLLITGSIELPKTVSETGGHASVIEEQNPGSTESVQEQMFATSEGAVPVPAKKAVSALQTGDVLPKPKNQKRTLTVILSILGGIIVAGTIVIIVLALGSGALGN